MLFQTRARRTLKAGLYQPGAERKRYGKSAPSAPAAPDPATVANAQSAANSEAVQKSAEVNQINQVSPYGSQTYSGTIGQPDRTLTTTLNPTDQATLDKQRQLANQLTGSAQNVGAQVSAISQTPFSLSGVTQLPTEGDLTGALQNAQDAVYARNTQYLDPQFAQGQHDLETQLANQGIPVGSEAYSRAMGDFSRQKQQAYSDARDAAIQAGSAQEAQQFGLGQATQQQDIQNLLLSRQEPMNELAAYLQGSPAINSPSFAPPAQYNVNPADVTGAYGINQAAQNAAYQGGVSSAASGNSATAGLVGAGLTAAVIF
jgi:hypothetical protein